MSCESDLDDAADYLSGRLPNAFVGDVTDLILFVSKNEEELWSQKNHKRCLLN